MNPTLGLLFSRAGGSADAGPASGLAMAPRTAAELRDAREQPEHRPEPALLSGAFVQAMQRAVDQQPAGAALRPPPSLDRPDTAVPPEQSGYALPDGTPLPALGNPLPVEARSDAQTEVAQSPGALESAGPPAAARPGAEDGSGVIQPGTTARIPTQVELPLAAGAARPAGMQTFDPLELPAQAADGSALPALPGQVAADATTQDAAPVVPASDPGESQPAPAESLSGQASGLLVRDSGMTLALPGFGADRTAQHVSPAAAALMLSRDGLGGPPPGVGGVQDATKDGAAPAAPRPPVTTDRTVLTPSAPAPVLSRDAATGERTERGTAEMTRGLPLDATAENSGMRSTVLMRATPDIMGAGRPNRLTSAFSQPNATMARHAAAHLEEAGTTLAAEPVTSESARPALDTAPAASRSATPLLQSQLQGLPERLLQLFHQQGALLPRRFQIQLNPVELGRIDIQIQQDRDQIGVTLSVQNPAARELIEAQMPRLRQSLDGLGAEVAVAVDSGQQQSRDRADDWREFEWRAAPNRPDDQAVGAAGPAAGAWPAPEPLNTPLGRIDAYV